MKMYLKTILNKEKSLKHIKFSGGNISLASKNALLSRTQLYYWIKNDEVYRNKVVDIICGIENFSECKLLRKALLDDTKALAALQKKSGKQRNRLSVD